MFLGNFFLWNLSWNVIYFGSLDLTLMYMIKREFECLFGRYKSYLHIVIFNEGKRSREEGEKNKREKDKEIKSRKKAFQ